MSTGRVGRGSWTGVHSPSPPGQTDRIAPAEWADPEGLWYHPSTWYLPPDAFRPGSLVPAAGSSVCEWKGRAVYLDVVGGGVTAARAAWSYPRPIDPYGALAGFVAVYAGRMDACFVDGETVRPQPGGFYGGWITDDVAGPFKGEPGTLYW